MKNAGKIQSVKKLRTITVVCLLVSCLFGAIFITSEQVSASDNVYMHAKEYVINQGETLILPPISGMLIGGVIGSVFGGLPGAVVLGTIGGTIGTAISAAKNMLTFTKRTTDWSSLTTTNDKNSLRSLALARAVVAPIGSAIFGVKNMLTFTKGATDWGSLITANDKNSLRNLADQGSIWTSIDKNSLKRTTNEITMPVLENTFWDSLKVTPTYINPYKGSYPSFDTSDIPKLRTDHIPKINIPDSIPNFNPK